MELIHSVTLDYEDNLEDTDSSSLLVQKACLSFSFPILLMIFCTMLGSDVFWLATESSMDPSFNGPAADTLESSCSSYKGIQITGL